MSDMNGAGLPAASGSGGSMIGPRLSAMMFLEFFVWGAWFVTLGPFMTALGMTPEDIGNAYSTAPIAAIIAPFFLGIVADRFFASQAVMGALHFVGGLLLLAAPSLADPQHPLPFIGILLLHMICYMPTLGLSNTVAFNSMTNPQKQFPMVRVFGTIGWIVAGFVVGYVAQVMVADQPGVATEAARAAAPHFFYVAGAGGILLGIFSFTLPSTPPPMRGKPFNIRAAIGLDALALLKDRSFAVFAVSSLLICIPLAAYYSFASVYAGATGVQHVPVKMSFGQMSEVFFMLIMPIFFARLGVKWMLAAGMLGWVLRYGLFAGAWNGAGSDHLKWMVLGGIILHGLCYDFFFVTGQIYTEQRAPREIRAQAQGFLVLITQGIGMLIGNQVFARLVDRYTKTTSAPGVEPAVKVTDWQSVWLIPCLAAAVILVIFVLMFRDRTDELPVEADALPA